MKENFEEILSGGHHNSLGKTLEVVEMILKDRSKLEALYNTYFSEDELVRLRVSNAFKRVCLQHPDWVYEYFDRLAGEISKINQASTQWTLAILFRLTTHLQTKEQHEKAINLVKHNLLNHEDWIVLNTTMQTIFEWSKKDNELVEWLIPVLKKYEKDPRKSVAGRAKKYLKHYSSKT